MEALLTQKHKFIDICKNHSLEENSFKRMFNVFLLYNKLNTPYQKL